MCGGKLDSWDQLNYTAWEVMGKMNYLFMVFLPYEQFQRNEF